MSDNSTTFRKGIWLLKKVRIHCKCRFHFRYSVSNLVLLLQAHWVKNLKKYSTGFWNHFSTNFGPIWPKLTINYRSMWCKLRCQDFKDIHGFGKSAESDILSKSIDILAILTTEAIPSLLIIWTILDQNWLKMASETCNIQWWPKRILTSFVILQTKSFYHFWPPLYFRDFLLIYSVHLQRQN